jgi:hypothetical protein
LSSYFAEKAAEEKTDASCSLIFYLNVIEIVIKYVTCIIPIDSDTLKDKKKAIMVIHRRYMLMYILFVHILRDLVSPINVVLLSISILCQKWNATCDTSNYQHHFKYRNKHYITLKIGTLVVQTSKFIQMSLFITLKSIVFRWRHFKVNVCCAHH